MGLTKAELDYYTRVPNLLADLVSELKKLNKNLENLKGSATTENGE
jgi:hypothetical protein